MTQVVKNKNHWISVILSLRYCHKNVQVWSRSLWGVTNDMELQFPKPMVKPRISNLVFCSARSHRYVKRRETDFLHFLQRMLSRPVDQWVISPATQIVTQLSSLLRYLSKAFEGEQTHWVIYHQKARSLWYPLKHRHLFPRGNLWGITQWAQRLLTWESKTY